MKAHWLLVFCTLFPCIGTAIFACADDDDDDDGDDDEAAMECDESTCTDPLTGLTWQQAPPSKYMSWEEAIARCENLSLAGGGWRLPTISELRSLIRACDATGTGGSCGVTDSCLELGCLDASCSGCGSYGGPGPIGEYWPAELEGGCCLYWSSSPVADGDNLAWYANFHIGSVNYNDVSDNWDFYVRCVR